jgi:alpha-tubulin suppressor-like RCC1 family protein
MKFKKWLLVKRWNCPFFVDDALVHLKKWTFSPLLMAVIGIWCGHAVRAQDFYSTKLDPDGLPWYRRKEAFEHGCGITNSKVLFCWGRNYAGELGVPVPNQDYRNLYHSRVKVVSEYQGRFVDLALGINHSCVLTDFGAVLCFGSNSFGELGRQISGNFDEVPREVEVPNRQGRFVGIVALSKKNSTCAWTDEGQVYCWGYNWFGEIGSSHVVLEDRSVAVQVSIPIHEIVLKVEDDSSKSGYCAQTLSQKNYCWGRGFGTTPILQP